MNNEKTDALKISPEATILSALKQMDFLNRRLLIVFGDTKFEGLLSIGDIQRGIIRNMPLDSEIREIQRKGITVADENDSLEKIKSQMAESGMEFIPVLDFKGDLVNVYFWEDFFSISKPFFSNRKLKLPVVIMAGGKGIRLKPFTDLIPKPLLPFGDSTIIDRIIRNFAKQGNKEFYISLNYMAEKLKDHFGKNHSPFKINFIQEDKPLGSAGSLSLLKNKIKGTFWVTNCDIILNEDYSSIYDFHIANKNDITIIAVIKQYKLPYGVIKTGEAGILSTIDEKPEVSFKINSGIYLVEPSVLNMIPENSFLKFTELINSVKKEGKVGVFPVSEKSWTDIGSLEMYLAYKPD